MFSVLRDHFPMTETKGYTTQLQAGLGMIHETIDLLRLWQPGDNASKLAQKAVGAGVFSRTTARRARNIATEMFAPRFLNGFGPPAVFLKQIAERHHEDEDLSQLFFLYTARAQSVFGEFVTSVYWPKYSAGSRTLNKSEAETFVRRALDNGRMQKRWSDSTIRRVSGYLMGCCSDFGLVAGAPKSERPIKRFTIRPRVALYLAYELHFSGNSDISITRHCDWRLFGLEPLEVTKQLKSLAPDGHLIVQATTDLVHISWRYPSMESCLDAITKR
jgi:hypothetical protein